MEKISDEKSLAALNSTSETLFLFQTQLERFFGVCITKHITPQYTYLGTYLGVTLSKTLNILQ
jgi:hypothetical protein